MLVIVKWPRAGAAIATRIILQQKSPHHRVAILIELAQMVLLLLSDWLTPMGIASAPP
jgi:hypothetical protein